MFWFLESCDQQHHHSGSSIHPHREPTRSSLSLSLSFPFSFPSSLPLVSLPPSLSFSSLCSHRHQAITLKKRAKAMNITKREKSLSEAARGWAAPPTNIFFCDRHRMDVGSLFSLLFSLFILHSLSLSFGVRVLGLCQIVVVAWREMDGVESFSIATSLCSLALSLPFFLFVFPSPPFSIPPLRLAYRCQCPIINLVLVMSARSLGQNTEKAAAEEHKKNIFCLEYTKQQSQAALIQSSTKCTPKNLSSKKA